jgi:RimJ/RimL family protein N-acetyltransferase
LDEVLAEIDAANIASVSVAERIGLRRQASGTSEGREWLRYALARHETADPQAV